MEFFLKNYQHTLETLKQILWLIDAFVHLLFAGAVAKDCGYMIKRGMRPILVSPSTWAFTALIGGVWAAGLYWVLHHSSLMRTFSSQTREKHPS